MGYRSDIAVGIGFLTKEQLAGFVTGFKMRHGGPGTDVLDHFVVQPLEFSLPQPTDPAEPRLVREALTKQGWMLVAYFERWKWYSDYDKVKLVNQLLSDSEEAGFPSAFVRIGENDDDNEWSHNEGGDQGEWSAADTTALQYLGYALHAGFGINRSLTHPLDDEAPGIADFLNPPATEGA